MVRAGGEGGFLEEALDRVATFTEQQEDLKSRTHRRAGLPGVSGDGRHARGRALLVFFVPKFEEMFARLRERGELPLVTEWLLGVQPTGCSAGGWMIRCWPWRAGRLRPAANRHRRAAGRCSIG